MLVDETEEFKPIPVRAYNGITGRLMNAARLVVDLQLLTCTRFLRPHLASASGSVLDVGCGEMPFRPFLPLGVRYVGLDVPAATDFGMRDREEIVAFDGLKIPFEDESYDMLICTEVLEHAVDPVGLIEEMYRVLRPGGVLIVTVPFAARVHHAPYDFHRFTRFRLAQMFSSFRYVEISERGNDITVIANKMIVLCARLITQKRIDRRMWGIGVAIVLAPLTALSLAFAHLSLLVGGGSKNDPLGYGLIARKD